MPWFTPTLRKVREMVRDDITASLYGASFIGNNVLRVMAEAMAGLAHHTLRYIDWLGLQLMPDTAETEWLDRHGDIWLTNADATIGRKMATFAVGEVGVTGAAGAAVASGTRLVYGQAEYEATQLTILGADVATPLPVRALDPGASGNIDPGTAMSFATPVPGIDGLVTVIDISGGADVENDDDLRVRVLERIRQPPMGGAQHDYLRWTKAVPGVTRAWCAGNEMGMGTVTVRFMMDDLRASNDGYPLEEDINVVTEYLDSVRPVTVKDMFVVAPLKYVMDVNISNLVPDNAATRAAIEDSLREMLLRLAAPGQTIFVAWKYCAVLDAAGVVSFDLIDKNDDVMPSMGHMATLGDIFYAEVS
jgi:uncharacterized phage protein gp47/JayE